MSVSDIAKRLTLAREHAGYVSARSAALKNGWKYQSYATHENGTRNLPLDVAARYAKVYRVSPDFILFGTNPPAWYGKGKSDIVRVETPLRVMPIFHDIPATDIERLLASKAQGQEFSISDQADLPPSCFAIKVQTTEMVGGGIDIKPDDIIICDRACGSIQPGWIVILSVKRQDQPSLRKVKALAGGKFSFVGANQDDYEPLFDNEVKVIGRAIRHIRSI